MDKINEFKDSLKCVEGFVGTKIVEERGRKHIVLATTQDNATIVDYNTPSCEPIRTFGEHFGFSVSMLPFPTENGVCYDIVVRERRAA